MTNKMIKREAYVTSKLFFILHSVFGNFYFMFENNKLERFPTAKSISLFNK